MANSTPLRSGAEALRPRFERLALRHARLMGVREAAETREAALVVKVGHAKGRLSVSEEVQATLEGLQQLAHERSVGIFERLLTAILKDVLPDKGAVKLELGTERGLPSLRVRIDNNGYIEDAFEESGGAVTNILVAGLRFSALSRTKNRRFMVLDEPDCWLKPDLVPAFIKVLAEVSVQAQTQTLLISHYDPSNFEGMTNLVRLAAGPAGPFAQALEPRLTQWTDDEAPGVRSIRLINFKAHKDTLIPLFPGITALIGENDLGKSTAAIAAIRAVAYADSSDTVIHHGATEARIIITLEKGRRIEWVRRLTGSPRVTYALYENNSETATIEGPPPVRGQAPTWVVEALGISKVDDLDIQLRSQKEPVFLMDQAPSMQAKLLSVGRESGRLHELIESYGDLKRKDREQVREGEIEVMQLRQRIAGSANLLDMPPVMDKLSASISEVENSHNRQQQLKRVLDRLESAAGQLAGHTMRLAALTDLPKNVPELTNTRALSQVVARIESAQRQYRESQLRFGALAALPQNIPEIKDTKPLARLMGTLEKAGPIARLARAYPEVNPPVLKDLARLRELGLRIARLAPKSAIKVPVVPVTDAPKASDLAGLARLIATLERTTRLSAHVLPQLPAEPALLKDSSGIARAGSRLVTQQTALAKLEQELVLAKVEEVAAREELQAVAAELGGLCPLCSGELPEDLGGIGHSHTNSLETVA